MPGLYGLRMKDYSFAIYKSKYLILVGQVLGKNRSTRYYSILKYEMSTRNDRLNLKPIDMSNLPPKNLKSYDFFIFIQGTLLLIL